jgi:hypothetical protein
VVRVADGENGWRHGVAPYTHFTCTAGRIGAADRVHREAPLRHYPDKSSAAYLDLESLGERLRHEYDSVYGHEESPPAPVSKKATGRAHKKPSGETLPGATIGHKYKGLDISGAARPPIRSPAETGSTGQGQFRMRQPFCKRPEEARPAPLDGRTVWTAW